jgi:hypothetical protein
MAQATISGLVLSRRTYMYGPKAKPGEAPVEPFPLFESLIFDRVEKNLYLFRTLVADPHEPLVVGEQIDDFPCRVEGPGNVRVTICKTERGQSSERTF